MAYTLNTSHALYGNIIELIGVEAGALVSHITSRTFTVDASASFGTGTYGEHLHSAGDNLNVHGASFDPAVIIDTRTTAKPNITIFVVMNGLTSASQYGTLMNHAANTFNPGYELNEYPAAFCSTVRGATGTASLAGTAHSICITRTGETASETFANGTSVGTAGRLCYNTGAATWSYIGGEQGSGSIVGDIVWIVWFDKVLTATEISDLHTSLGASNSFALIQGATPVTFSGTVPAQSDTIGTTFSLDLSTYFSGTATPFTYALAPTSSALPGGLTLAAATGIISGTSTVAGSFTNIIIRATDANAATADTNAFSIAITTAIAFSGTIAGQFGYQDTAFSYDSSIHFAGQATPFSYAIQTGTLPTGVTINSSTGVVSGTPTALESKTGIVIRATDASAATADSNAFDFHIDTAPTLLTNVPELTGNVGTLYEYNLATHFLATETLTYSLATGTLPTGVTLSAVGVLSGTPTTVETKTGLAFRVTDTHGTVLDSNTVSFTVSAATGGTITTEPFKNNTGTVLASTLIAKVAIMKLSDMSVLLTYANQTTAVDGTLEFTDALLVPATAYLVVCSDTTGTAVGIKLYTAV